jgi:hypothetical protein
MSGIQGPSKQSKHNRGFNSTINAPVPRLLLKHARTSHSRNYPYNYSHNGPLLARRRFVKHAPMHIQSPTNKQPELINIHSAFHAGAYQQVLDFDTSNFSSSKASVSSELSSEKTPDLVAVKLLADYEQGKDVVEQAKKLAEQHGQENLTVQLCVGMVLERAGETDAALEVLGKHQGSLDAYVQSNYAFAMGEG